MFVYLFIQKTAPENPVVHQGMRCWYLHHRFSFPKEHTVWEVETLLRRHLAGGGVSYRFPELRRELHRALIDMVEERCHLDDMPEGEPVLPYPYSEGMSFVPPEVVALALDEDDIVEGEGEDPSGDYSARMDQAMGLELPEAAVYEYDGYRLCWV